LRHLRKSMKILAITSHFPPYHMGGYEVRCKNVLDRLADRGHEIQVITSEKGKEETATRFQEKNVHRQFHLLDSSKNIANRTVRDYFDLKFLDGQISSFKPDLIYLWNTINLSRAIFPFLAERSLPIVYDEGGAGLIYSWRHGGSWYAFLDRTGKSRFKNGLRVVAGKLVSWISGNLIKTKWKWPENMRVYFNSDLGLRNSVENKVPVDGAPVIYSGLEIEKFPFLDHVRISSPIRIIVPGRIEPPKGQKDAILLLQLLREKELDAQLIIVGRNNSDHYFREVEETIKELALERNVLILPMVDQDKLVDLYHQSDVCFFSSYHHYGFSRIPMEAMACGCLVIAYGHEGSDEIIENKKTGYIVQPGDFQTMIEIIQGNVSDPSAYRQIVTNARQVVEQKYSMDTYVDRIESILFDSVNAGKGSSSLA
jgi:glycogen synthase